MRRRDVKRNSAIDCIRVFAIITVIFAHVVNEPYAFPAKFIDHFHFVLVFFLIVAGYHWGKKIRAGNAVGQEYARYSFSILKIFVVWSLIYIVIPRNINEIVDCVHMISHYGVLSLLKIPYWRLLTLVKGQEPLQAVLYIFLTGTRYHLWFLMTLVWASTITAMLVRWKRESWLIWVGIGLYIFSALSLVLSAASPGFSIPFNTRHGPFLGTIFFAIGWRLSSHRGAFTCKPAIALLSGGFVILTVDILFVRNQFGFMIVQPFLDTTIGVGCVLLALARPSFGADTILPSLGRYVLGIYLIHPAFIDFLKPVAFYIPGRARGLVFPTAVFLFSALAVMIFQRIKVMRPFVAIFKGIYGALGTCFIRWGVSRGVLQQFNSRRWIYRDERKGDGDPAVRPVASGSR
jgi:surface polysaccharide O-acyltransferase-like enzyme